MTAPAWWWLWWWWGRLLQLQPQAQLEAALGRLSICETRPEGVTPYRDLIPGIARQLMIMRRNDDRPGTPLATQLKPTVSRLQGLAQSEHWDGLAQDDRPASYHLPLPLRLRLIRLAAEAGELAREMKSVLSDTSRRPRGRPKNTAAPRIASYLYQEFERLTGRAPGRSVGLSGDEKGGFTVLVREVFEILGVKSSPEVAARQAIEAANSMVINQERDLF